MLKHSFIFLCYATTNTYDPGFLTKNLDPWSQLPFSSDPRFSPPVIPIPKLKSWFLIQKISWSLIPYIMSNPDPIYSVIRLVSYLSCLVSCSPTLQLIARKWSPIATSRHYIQVHRYMDGYTKNSSGTRKSIASFRPASERHLFGNDSRDWGRRLLS